MYITNILYDFCTINCFFGCNLFLINCQCSNIIFEGLVKIVFMIIHQSNVVQSDSTLNGLFAHCLFIYNKCCIVKLKSLVEFCFLFIDHTNIVESISKFN